MSGRCRNQIRWRAAHAEGGEDERKRARKDPSLGGRVTRESVQSKKGRLRIQYGPGDTASGGHRNQTTCNCRTAGKKNAAERGERAPPSVPRRYVLGTAPSAKSELRRPGGEKNRRQEGERRCRIFHQWDAGRKNRKEKKATALELRFYNCDLREHPQVACEFSQSRRGAEKLGKKSGRWSRVRESRTKEKESQGASINI